MNNTITKKDLDGAIDTINKLVPQKTFSLLKTPQVWYVATDQGERRVMSGKTKQSLYDQLWAFIEGLRILKTFN
tara:strand:- start:955 stop:1176 length:222 start_codon:yes stop_codon:yes gene_type:complete